MFSDVVNRLRLCRGLRLISRGRHRIENVAVDIERLGLRALRLNLGRCSQHRKDKAQDHIFIASSPFPLLPDFSSLPDAIENQILLSSGKQSFHKAPICLLTRLPDIFYATALRWRALSIRAAVKCRKLQHAAQPIAINFAQTRARRFMESIHSPITY